VGDKNGPLLIFPLALTVPNAGNAPALLPAFGATIDARNGLAAPKPTPVACGRNPTPREEPAPSGVSPLDPVPLIPFTVGKLVCCGARRTLPLRPVLPFASGPPPMAGEETPLRLAPSPTPAGRPKPLVPLVPKGGDAAAKAASVSGVVGADCGIGGSASSSDAPNDDVGLKALTPPPKPVVCGRKGAPVGWLDKTVLPVDCTPGELKSDVEKVDPVVVVVAKLGGDEVVVLDEPSEVNGDVAD